MTDARFRELRLMLGLSQAKAAQVLGCSERQIRDMEKGRTEIRRAYGIALAAEYHHAARQARMRAENAETSAQGMLEAACEEDGL